MFLGALGTPDAGTYYLEFRETIIQVTTTPHFEKAVQTVMENKIPVVGVQIGYSLDTGYYLRDYTYENLLNFLNNNVEIRLIYGFDRYYLSRFDGSLLEFCNIGFSGNPGDPTIRCLRITAESIVYYENYLQALGSEGK